MAIGHKRVPLKKTQILQNYLPSAFNLFMAKVGSFNSKIYTEQSLLPTANPKINYSAEDVPLLVNCYLIVNNTSR